VAGFDASIFMYGEDVELGERLGCAGWQLWLVPEARAWHKIASSQSGVSTRWIDSLHEAMARRSGRVRLMLFDFVLGVSLLGRAAASRGRRPESRLHRRRMKASGGRSLRLAWTALRRGTAAAIRPEPPESPEG
jgi:GT2 family glycosyltransferase